jgi:hypothetical protein
MDMKVVALRATIPFDELEEAEVTPEQLRDELGEYLMSMYDISTCSIGVDITDDGQTAQTGDSEEGEKEGSVEATDIQEEATGEEG